jgi:chitin disaccharide deacetylase
VNADDLGSDVQNTDAILACSQAGAISSTTAMVFMADSERAAALARSHDLPVGLHLNLTMRYTAPGAPEQALRRQAQAVDLFAQARDPHRAWRPANRLICACVEDQLDEFRRLYGREPTHVDGHNHAHLSANVILSRALPSGLRVRRAVNWPPPRDTAGRLKSRARDRALARFETTSYFCSIRTLHPWLGGHGLGDLLDTSDEVAVEIMTHPGWHDELKVLLSPEWQMALAGRPLGSYLMLPPRLYAHAKAGQRRRATRTADNLLVHGAGGPLYEDLVAALLTFGA